MNRPTVDHASIFNPSFSGNPGPRLPDHLSTSDVKPYKARANYHLRLRESHVRGYLEDFFLAADENCKDVSDPATVLQSIDKCDIVACHYGSLSCHFRIYLYVEFTSIRSYDDGLWDPVNKVLFTIPSRPSQELYKDRVFFEIVNATKDCPVVYRLAKKYTPPYKATTNTPSHPLGKDNLYFEECSGNKFFSARVLSSELTVSNLKPLSSGLWKFKRELHPKSTSIIFLNGSACYDGVYTRNRAGYADAPTNGQTLDNLSVPFFRPYDASEGDYASFTWEGTYDSAAGTYSHGELAQLYDVRKLSNNYCLYVYEKLLNPISARWSEEPSFKTGSMTYLRGTEYVFTTEFTGADREFTQIERMVAIPGELNSSRPYRLADPASGFLGYVPLSGLPWTAKYMEELSFPGDRKVNVFVAENVQDQSIPTTNPPTTDAEYCDILFTIRTNYEVSDPENTNKSVSCPGISGGVPTNPTDAIIALVKNLYPTKDPFSGTREEMEMITNEILRLTNSAPNQSVPGFNVVRDANVDAIGQQVNSLNSAVRELTDRVGRLSHLQTELQKSEKVSKRQMDARMNELRREIANDINDVIRTLKEQDSIPDAFPVRDDSRPGGLDTNSIHVSTVYEPDDSTVTEDIFEPPGTEIEPAQNGVNAFEVLESAIPLKFNLVPLYDSDFTRYLDRLTSRILLLRDLLKQNYPSSNLEGDKSPDRISNVLYLCSYLTGDPPPGDFPAGDVMLLEGDIVKAYTILTGSLMRLQDAFRNSSYERQIELAVRKTSGTSAALDSDLAMVPVNLSGYKRPELESGYDDEDDNPRPTSRPRPLTIEADPAIVSEDDL